MCVVCAHARAASELVKVFAREPSAQAALGPILAALVVSSCQELGSLQVRALGGAPGARTRAFFGVCVCVYVCCVCARARRV